MRSLTYDGIEREIIKNKFLRIDFPLRKKELEAAANAFLRFLELPDPIKKRYLYQMLDENDRGSKVGYVPRKKKEGHSDNKEMISYRPIFHDLFRSELQFADPKVTICFDKIREVYHAGKLIMLQIFRALDEKIPGLYDQFYVEGECPRFKVRFLKYDNTQDGNFLAKAHYDRGTCTLAISESGPGLRTGLNDSDLEPVQHTDKQALWFPGVRGKEVFNEKFHPLWHDVVQLESDNVNDKVARWAIVFFVSYPGDRGSINYEEAHTPIY
jgi:hypothetical protein